MAIIGFVGEIGSGKSLAQLHFGLHEANRKMRYLVCNFPLNQTELLKYCRMAKLGWVAHCAQTGRVLNLSAMDSLSHLLSYGNSIVLLDEAGIFLNSREFQKTPKSFLRDLAQSRKDGIDLFWAAQFDDQVDKQFRQLTQQFIHCAGSTTWCPVLRRPKLVWKTNYRFFAGDYYRWASSSRARVNFIKTWFGYASQTIVGPVTPLDLQLFKVFDSFARLDSEAPRDVYGTPILPKFPTFLPENLPQSVRHTRRVSRWANLDPLRVALYRTAYQFK